MQEIKVKLDKLKSELDKRYNNKIPDSVKDIFRLQNHILTKIENWISTKSLEKNIDAEIFMDSFDNQLNELVEILKEIDQEFGQ